jgi:hypothetical protein
MVKGRLVRYYLTDFFILACFLRIGITNTTAICEQ